MPGSLLQDSSNIIESDKTMTNGSIKNSDRLEIKITTPKNDTCDEKVLECSEKSEKVPYASDDMLITHKNTDIERDSDSFSRDKETILLTNYKNQGEKVSLSSPSPSRRVHFLNEMLEEKSNFNLEGEIFLPRSLNPSPILKKRTRDTISLPSSPKVLKQNLYDIPKLDTKTISLKIPPQKINTEEIVSTTKESEAHAKVLEDSGISLSLESPLNSKLELKNASPVVLEPDVKDNSEVDKILANSPNKELPSENNELNLDTIDIEKEANVSNIEDDKILRETDQNLPKEAQSDLPLEIESTAKNNHAPQIEDEIDNLPVTPSPNLPTTPQQLSEIDKNGVKKPSIKKRKAPTPSPLLKSPLSLVSTSNKSKNYPTELNPFGSEEGEEEDEDDSSNPFSDNYKEVMEIEKTPQPSPRRLRAQMREEKSPVPKPRILFKDKTPPVVGSNPFEAEEEDGVSLNSSIHSTNVSCPPSPSPSSSIRSRKSRRAPLPPGFISPSKPPIPLISKFGSNDGVLLGSGGRRLIAAPPNLVSAPLTPSPSSSKDQPLINSEKNKKKRRAPPPKRRVEPIPESAIKIEMEDLEIRKGELERQGVELELAIRAALDKDDKDEEKTEEMMVQFFSVVAEKNDCVRRQAELEYLTRGHRLEEKQADLEFKLRILMDTPESQKKETDAETEKELLSELIKVVDERNEVVDWLDFHRRMELEEDLLLSSSLNSFSLSSSSTPPPFNSSSPLSSLGSSSSLHAKSKLVNKKERSLPDLVGEDRGSLSNKKDKGKNGSGSFFSSLTRRKKKKRESIGGGRGGL